MNWLYKLLGWLFGWDKQVDEYWQRFITPEIERARRLGIDDMTIGAMLRYSFDHADGISRYPRAILRDMIDEVAPFYRELQS